VNMLLIRMSVFECDLLKGGAKGFRNRKELQEMRLCEEFF